MERNEDSGKWISEDGGTTWMLTEPSESFVAEQSSYTEPPPEPSPEVVAAQAISDEISSRIESAETVSELRLAITDGLAAAITSLGG